MGRCISNLFPAGTDAAGPWTTPEVVRLWTKCASAKSLQSCLVLCDPVDSSVHGIFQARTLAWVLCPLSEDRPDLGIKPESVLQADPLPSEPTGDSLDETEQTSSSSVVSRPD